MATGPAVLLPGVSVLARLVAEMRAAAAERLHGTSAGTAAECEGLVGRLDGLLVVPEGARASELERLRRAPTRASGTEMVRALERAAEIQGLGAGAVEADVPSGRVEVLARYGLTTKAVWLRRLPEPRRTATLVATARHLEVTAVDDALDLFSVLMATRLLAWAERESAKARLRSLPELARASATLAAAARVLLDSMATGEAISVGDLWAAVDDVVPRGRLLAAVDVVENLAPADDDAGETARRVELVKRYATVRPFLALLVEVIPFAATDAGAPVLAAVRALPELVGRKKVRADEVVADIVPPGWRRLVFDPDSEAGAVEHRAYVICVLEALYRALRRRDVYAVGSLRWGDPRAQLLDGDRWQAAKASVLAGLGIAEEPDEHLVGLADRLDDAYQRLAVRLDPATTDAGRVRVVTDADGRARLHLGRLDAVGEPASLVELRDTVAAMLPRVDLPELLLEVHAWAGYLDEFTHLSEAGTRMDELGLPVAAVLVAEGCNLGFAPVVKPSHPALTRDRLSHVEQNYLRNDTIRAANGRLIAAQADLDAARLWGGGLVASVDGLRFVVPVSTLNAGPNPKYFGRQRGLTWLNAINDQVAGIGAVVVPGTMRDSLHVLDVILNLDIPGAGHALDDDEPVFEHGGGEPASPAPELIATDTALYSDVVFGLFRLLGYQFSPRLADVSDQRFWRLTPPGREAADFGPLNDLARYRISYNRIAGAWPDMVRVAGSLATGTVRAHDLLRMLGRDGRPTPLGAAFAEYGRAAKTLHLLAMCDPDDETYRRTIHHQLTVQESRHRLARKIFHGQRGEVRQRYREGQEDQKRSATSAQLTTQSDSAPILPREWPP